MAQRPALAALAVIVGCRHDPAPVRLDLPESAPPPPPAELSQFSAPLAYDFGAVLKIVDRAVPLTFGSMDSVRAVNGDGRRHYAFAAERSPFTAYAEGNLIHLRATVSYSARGFYKPALGPTVSGSCGTGRPDERPRVLIELATPLTLTNDWHLKSAASIVTVEPASNDKRDHCDVTFLHRDVTTQVVAAARAGLTAHLASIDQKVADVNLRERFAGLWALLETPIRVRNGVWLVLAPKRLAIGSVTGRAHVLTIPVTLDAQPAIVTSNDEPQVAMEPLPPLGHDGLARLRPKLGHDLGAGGSVEQQAVLLERAGAQVGRRHVAVRMAERDAHEYQRHRLPARSRNRHARALDRLGTPPLRGPCDDLVLKVHDEQHGARRRVVR